MINWRQINKQKIINAILINESRRPLAHLGQVLDAEKGKAPVQHPQGCSSYNFYLSVVLSRWKYSFL